MRKFVSLLVLFAFSGCTCSPPPSGNYQPPVTTTTQTQAQSFLFNAEDFDLATVVAAIKADKVSGGDDLQRMINADNGINNVDLDHDGKIDFVSVTEDQSGTQRTLAFVAHPVTGAATTIATVQFSRTSTEIQVSAGYPTYVRGYDSRYYNFNAPAFGTGVIAGALFTSWLFRPARTVYIAPVPTVYTSRVVYTPAQIRTERTTYQTQTKVSPIVETRKPANFNPDAYAKRTTAAPTRPSASDSSFNSRGGTTKDFQVRSPTQPKATATAFGAAPRSVPASAPPAKSSPSSWSKSTSGSSSSWGSSRRKN